MGVESARQCIIDETKYAMNMYGIRVDRRHLELLADVICCKGRPIGLNRYGAAQLKTSPLILASFERTQENLFDSAFFSVEDKLRGVTE